MNGKASTTNIFTSTSSTLLTFNVSAPANRDISALNFTLNISGSLTFVNGTNTTNSGAFFSNSSNSSVRFSNQGIAIVTHGSSNVFSFNVSTLTNGAYTLNLSYYDTSSILNTSTVFNLTVDTTLPLLAYNASTAGGSGVLSGNATFPDTTINVNVTASDTNLANLTFILYTGATETAEYARANFTLAGVSTTAAGYGVNWTGLANGVYNFTVIATDLANNQNTSARRRITLDTTGPVATFIAPLNGTSVTNGLYLLQASAADTYSNVTLASFNITYKNASGSWIQNDSYTATTNVTSLGVNWSSTSVNISKYLEGMYRIYIHINDSLNNANNTAVSTLYIDRTAPTTARINLISAAQTYVLFNVTVADATSGFNNACNVTRSQITSITNVTSQGNYLVQNVTDSGLTCATTYNYTIVCNDSAGNVASINSTSITTTACDATTSSSSGGGGSSSATPSELVTGFTKSLYAGEVVTFKSGNDSHLFILLGVKNDSVSIQVSSTTQKATLAVGEEKKFDLNADGTYDIAVKLASIDASNKATVTLRSISEVINAAPTQPATEETPVGEAVESVTSGSLFSSIWFWIVVVVIIAIIVYIVVSVRRR